MKNVVQKGFMVLMALAMGLGPLLGLIVLDRGVVNVEVAQAASRTVDIAGSSYYAYDVKHRCIVRNSLGELYLFYSVSDGANYHVFYDVSDDNGLTWLGATTVATDASQATIDIDSSDTIHILYLGWDVTNDYLRYRQLDVGGVLSPVETVATQALASGTLGTGGMYVDTSGDDHIVYYKTLAGVFSVLYRERISTAWSGATSIYSEAGSGAAIPEIGPYNAAGTDVLVGWSDTDSKFYAMKRVSGTWGAAKTVGVYYTDNQVFVGRDQRIYYTTGTQLNVAYESGSVWLSMTLDSTAGYKQVAEGVGTGGSAVFATTSSTVVEWESGTLTPLDGMPPGGTNELGVCNQGINLVNALYMAYGIYNGDSYQLFFRVEGILSGGTGGTGTTQDTVVDSRLDGPMDVASRDIVVDSNGRIYVFYVDTVNYVDALYKYSDNNGETWSDTMRWDEGAPTNVGKIEAVDIGPDDVIHIVWKNVGNTTVFYRQIDHGVLGDVEYVRETPSPYGDWFPRTPGYLDSSGVFHVLLGIQTGGATHLYYKERPVGGFGEVWPGAPVDLGASDSMLGAAIGPWNNSGDVLVAYEGGGDNVYALKRIGGVWGSPELVSDTTAGTGVYVSRGTSVVNADIYASFLGSIEKISWVGDAWVKTVLDPNGVGYRWVIQSRAASKAAPFWWEADTGKVCEYITWTSTVAEGGIGIGGCDIGYNIPDAAMVVYNYVDGVNYQLKFFSQVPPPDPGASPLVLTNNATGMDETSAVLNGWLSYCTNPCNYSFQWSQTSGGPYETMPWSSGTVSSGDAFSATLSGLAPGRTYYFRAVCRNAVNAAALGYGVELYFSTDMVLPIVTTQAADEISVSTARLKAYLLGDGGGTCDVRFQWSPPVDGYVTGDDSALGAYGANDWAGQTFTTGEDYAMEGVALKLYRDVGGTPGMLTVEIYETAAGAPIGSPLASGAYNGNTLGVTGAWVAIDLDATVELGDGDVYAIVLEALDAGGAGDAVHWSSNSAGGYAEGAGLTSTNGGATWSVETDDCMFATLAAWQNTPWAGPYAQGDNVGFVIESLEAGRVYRFRAQAQNTLGIGTGATLCFITELTPFKPTSLMATSISYSEVFLTWTKGRGAYKTRVIWKKNGYPAAYNDIGDGVNGGIGSFDIGGLCTISGLAAGVTYYFAAWSFISSNGGEYVTVEPGTGVYTEEVGSGYQTVVSTEFLGTSSSYYVGDKVVNVTRSAEAEIDGFTSDGGTGTATLAGGILGQIDGDEFYIMYWTKTLATTSAGYSSDFQPYSLSPGGHTNWFLHPNDNAVPFLPGRGMLADAASQFGMAMGYMLFFCSMIAACMVGFAAFLVSRSLPTTVFAIGGFLLICMLLQTAPGWCFFLYVAIGAPTGYVLNKGAAV